MSLNVHKAGSYDLRETMNNQTGKRRFYVNGTRVNRETFDAAKFWRRLECIGGETRGHLTRQFCTAR